MRNLICLFLVSVAFSQDICELKIVKDEIEYARQNPDPEVKDVKCENNELILEYLFNDEIIQERKQEMAQFLQEQLTKLYCNGDISHFYKAGVDMNYKYSTTNIPDIFSIKLNQDSCK